MTSLGSRGARRILAAAYHDGQEPGYRCWRIGDNNSDGAIDLCYISSYGGWRIYQPYNDGCDTGWDIDRYTARLLLAGLLSEK